MTRRVMPAGLPPDAPAHMLELSASFPQGARALYEDDTPCAWACILRDAGSPRATLFVWVPPAARTRGRGTALWDGCVRRLSADGVTEVRTHYPDGDAPCAAFLHARGLKPWFSTEEMAYGGGPMAETRVFEPYRDADFEEYQALQAKAFYDLRRANGVVPYYLRPTAARRAEMARSADRFFLLRDGGQIVAGGCTLGDELDDVAVLPNYQGRGLGRAVVAHGVNDLLRRGQRPVLWCVGGNPARKLYARLGFAHVRTEHYCGVRL